MQVVYFTTKSGNTRRFVQRLGLPMREINSKTTSQQANGHNAAEDNVHATQLPIKEMDRENHLLLDAPYILVVPTYNGKVPAPVVRFLNQPQNRQWLRGVVGTGNINFGAEYAAAGRKISEKCQVPLIHTIEIFGSEEDAALINKKITNLHKEDA